MAHASVNAITQSPVCGSRQYEGNSCFQRSSTGLTPLNWKARSPSPSMKSNERVPSGSGWKWKAMSRLQSLPV